jgi:hypothetical protein
VTYMSETKPETETKPVVTPLDAGTLETCDRCPGASAVFSVLLPSGGELTFCRHCAITNGYATHDTPNWVHTAEGVNRSQGDAHA